MQQSKDKRLKKTFVEEARRKQILKVAIDEITTRGYKETSIQAIADKAGVSKGLLLYHFKTKKDLLSDVWTVLIDELFEHRRAKVDLKESAIDKLSTYIDAEFEFLLTHKQKFVALFSIGIDLTSKDGKNPWAAISNERCFRYLTKIIEDGIERGEFKSVTNGAIAPIIQGAIDGIAVQWFADPQCFSLWACKEKLVQILDIILSVSKK